MSTSKVSIILDFVIDSFTGNSKKVNKTIDSIVNNLDRVKNAAQKVGDFGTEVAKIGSGFALAFAAGAKDISTFEKNLSDVNSLIGNNQERLDIFTQQILELGPSMGKSADQLTQSLYSVLSAEVEAGSEMEVLVAATKLGEVALGSTTEAVSLITTALENYKNTNLTAGQAAGLFNSIVDKGKTTLGAMTNSLNTILGIASNLNVSLPEVSGAMQVLTKSLPTEQATTALGGLFRSFLQSADKFKESGVDIIKVLKEGGLTAALEELNKITQGNIVTTRKYITESNALNAAILLTGDNFESYNKGVQNAVDGIGKLEKNYTEKTKILSKSFDKISASISSTSKGIFLDLLPALKQGANGLLRFLEGIRGWTKENKSLLVTLTGLVGGLVLFLTIAATTIVIFSKIVTSVIAINAAILGASASTATLGGALGSLATGAGAAFVSILSTIVGFLVPFIAGFTGATVVIGGLALALTDLELPEFAKNILNVKNKSELWNNSLGLIKQAFIQIELSGAKAINEVLKLVGLNNKAQEEYINLLGATNKSIGDQIRNLGSLDDQIKKLGVSLNSEIGKLEGNVSNLNKSFLEETKNIDKGNKSLQKVYQERVENLKKLKDSLIGIIENQKAIAQSTGNTKEIEAANSKINEIQQNFLESMKEINSTYSQEVVGGIKSNNELLKIEYDNRIKILEDYSKKLLGAAEKEKEAAEKSGDVALIKRADEQLTNIKTETYQELEKLRKQHDETILSQIQESTDEAFKKETKSYENTIKDLKSKYENDQISFKTFQDLKIKAQQKFTNEAININNDYLGKALNEDLYNKNLAFQTNYSNLSISTQKTLNESLIGNDSEYHQKILEMRDKAFQDWLKLENKKLEIRAAMIGSENSIDQQLVQNKEMLENEFIENQINRETEFQGYKMDLAQENLENIKNIKGQESQEYQEAQLDIEALEIEHNTKLQDLNNELFEAEKQIKYDALNFSKEILNENLTLNEIEKEEKLNQLDSYYQEGLIKEYEYQDAIANIERAAEADSEAREGDFLNRKVTEYQQQAKIFSADLKQKLGSTFSAIMGEAIDVSTIHVARYSDIFGLELTHLESLVTQSIQKLKEDGLDLSKSTATEAVQLFDALGKQNTNNMGKWAEQFADYVNKVKGLMDELENYNKSLEEQLLQAEGEYVELVDLWKEEELSKLESKYKTDLGYTQEYYDAKENIEKLYQQKRQDALEQEAQATQDSIKSGLDTLTNTYDQYSEKINDSSEKIANGLGFSVSGGKKRSDDGINGSMVAFPTSGNFTDSIGDSYENINKNNKYELIERVVEKHEYKYDQKYTLTSLDNDSTDRLLRDRILPAMDQHLVDKFPEKFEEEI